MLQTVTYPKCYINMELRSEAYWNERYREGKIGWDLGGPSTPLKTYLDQVTDKGIRLLICLNKSPTFVSVFAEVSKNNVSGTILLA